MFRSGSKNENVGPTEVAKIVEDCGAGEILLTSINNDGTMNGYDYKLVEIVSSKASIPVIASGGRKTGTHAKGNKRVWCCSSGSCKHFSFY